MDFCEEKLRKLVIHKTNLLNFWLEQQHQQKRESTHGLDPYYSDASFCSISSEVRTERELIS